MVLIRRVLLLVIFSGLSIFFVGRAFAKETLKVAPVVREIKNSQYGYALSPILSAETTNPNSKPLSIDNNAISAEGDQGVAFMDAGISGGGQISVYVVHKGDTLPGIAKMFGVSTNTILWANDIKGNSIKEGDQLVILPISGVKHIVKKGDTLKSIATKYKADINDILAYNDVDINDKLNPGDEIIVPDGEMSITSSSNTVKNSINSLPSMSGYFMRPIIGGKKTQGIHGHNGVDLASSYGSPILAAADGVVIISRSGGWNGGYGTYVVISHPNGTQTLYAHMSKTTVTVGQHVNQGEQIGNMGNTGKVNGRTGIHLHFEVRGAKNPF